MKKLITATLLTMTMATSSVNAQANSGEYNTDEEVAQIVGGCTAATAAALASGPAFPAAAGIVWLICVVAIDQAVREGAVLPN